MNATENIARNLRNYMILNELSVKETAEATGLVENTVLNIKENRNTRIEKRHYPALCKFMELTEAQLTKGDMFNLAYRVKDRKKAQEAAEKLEEVIKAEQKTGDDMEEMGNKGKTEDAEPKELKEMLEENPRVKKFIEDISGIGYTLDLSDEKEDAINYTHEEEKTPYGENKTNEGVDLVNHPPHYCKNGIECIDIIKAITGDNFSGFLKGNVAKYLYRCENKGGVEDLEKAEWYLKRLIEEMKERE